MDDSLAPGIGRRRDGWPNRKLNVGAIIALSPVLTEAERELFSGWGPGKFDPRLQAFDGTQRISLNPTTLPVVIPPASGLRRIGFETFTADGPISVLEQLRRGVADGRPRQLQRSAHRARRSSRRRIG